MSNINCQSSSVWSYYLQTTPQPHIFQPLNSIHVTDESLVTTGSFIRTSPTPNSRFYWSTPWNVQH